MVPKVRQRPDEGLSEAEFSIKVTETKGFDLENNHVLADHSFDFTFVICTLRTA